MKKIKIPSINEHIYSFETNFKQRVYVLEKPEFYRIDVELEIPFGSSMQNFKSKNKEFKVHSGVAHFLEHMIFENSEKDISGLFAEYKSEVNAYTKEDKTAYYFSTVDDIYPPLRLLLDMVYHPSFDMEHIEKEREIILHELDMYDDELDQKIYYDLLKELYATHPIREDIGGTKEDVSIITKEELEFIHAQYYDPSTTVLFITGPVSAHEIEAFLNQYPFRKEPVREHYECIDTLELSNKEFSSKIVEKDLYSSIIMIGSKIEITNKSPKELLLLELTYLLIIDNLFTESGDFYEILEKNQLINNTFDYSISLKEEYQHILFYFDSSQPEEALKLLLPKVKEIPTTLLNKDLFEIQKNKLVGYVTMLWNRPNQAISFFSDYFKEGIDIELFYETLTKFSFEDLKQIQKEMDFSKTTYIAYIPKRDDELD